MILLIIIKKKKRKKTTARIQAILKEIIIPKQSSGKGNASTTLYKMRYGSEWKRYYPLAR